MSMTILQRCKTALRVTTTAYDDEISGYIDAARLDMGIAGVDPDTEDALVETAIVCYVRMRFGSPSDFERMKAAYDEQKAQLQIATGYTDWGDAE